jgi:hypothetical protein
VEYGHHRWIFTLAGRELRLIAKFPLASFFDPRRRWIGRIRSSGLYQRFKKIAHPGKPPTLRDTGYLRWWDKGLAERNNELAFVWTGPLTYRVINGDHAGHSIHELAKMYAEDLADGL